ncbi:MAG: metal-dependent phosphohydrolase, partial [Chloroflexi bacterium]|nr:metal-dependent phosphohydrolase [Chloroflexota bacterium]
SDSFYDLVSARPERDALMPNEAVEYVMAYSGELFDPELVQLLTANVPLYPSGVMVKLSTGESGVISRNTPGNFSRPVVRIFFNKRGRPKINPYDIDLAHKDYQDQLIVQILKK